MTTRASIVRAVESVAEVVVAPRVARSGSVMSVRLMAEAQEAARRHPTR